MEWIADVSAGDWLRERLDPDFATMHGVVPRGFPAYARIFHPPQVRSLPDRAVPTMDEWMRMPDAEQQRLTELFTDEPTTWSAAAAAFGTTMHADAQWQRIVRTPVDGDWHSRIAADGREFTSPDEGRLTPEVLAAIAAHLITDTSTPDDGFAAVWEGWEASSAGCNPRIPPRLSPPATTRDTRRCCSRASTTASTIRSARRSGTPASSPTRSRKDRG